MASGAGSDELVSSTRAVSSRSSSSARRPRVNDEVQDLPDFCARPSCRQQFVKVNGPGRRQAFCSELCRRAAERELRQARARLTHFEGLVDQLRVDIAAFGRANLHEPGNPANLQTQRVAEDAIARAGGIVTFLESSPDPLARELKALYEAVTPLLGHRTA